MRRLTAAAGAVLLSCAVSGVVADAASAAPAQPCHYKAGTDITAIPWAQTRLNFQRIWSITQGQNVKVAVVDTGLNKQNPQMAGITTIPGVDTVHSGWGTADCDEHGTEVTSLIAAQRTDGSALVGVAPRATIMPIKQTLADKDPSGTAYTLAAGINAAVQAKVDVINLSVYVKAKVPALLAAVQAAAKQGIVVVCAAGNEGTTGNPVTYPAAYSATLPNVIAVAATDRSDVIAPFSESGSYVNVAAPGAAVLTANPGSGSKIVDGTSFSAPYVTGVVALMLGAHPKLTPLQVRERLQATADRPPEAVPSTHYGYGIVNPYLAVTALGTTTVQAPDRAVSKALPPITVPPPPSRHLQHVALAVGFGLLGLAAAVIALAAVWRTAARARRPRST